ncbi:short-chain dehydrogenase/reductase [Paractinoplanes abujensis]|uniref:NAD(P)-dependent dehydrogenase (Short-subunit alcohol dehydrogenase family) n=1 Tax=Paractinoplanes abujensis TaxID=882441 RepID=A0A7W7CQD2_9ACTN|nr:SDR family NAD(P)-dependent oxidoreductase [Actinoplanes abujensis]MBB4692743.1 NAD(P)-dependent dehydrogenase (short-subunit alcohol dehydrogenase family) [Actinoplanes abujensis]GID22758.1 short-chain dehydrogenase/reductase [Actinoplanes abujensis]
MSRTWFITGSSRGLGRELTIAALDAGDNVVATARRPEQLKDLATDRLLPLALDVTDPAAVAAAVAAAVDRFGRLDVVVNNAGYANSGSIEDTPMDDFRAQVEANFFGAVLVTKAALPILRRQRSGHFLQFSSIGGRVGGTAGNAAYQAAKHALEGFSNVLNTEVAPLGIKVTIVEPGPFRTGYGSSMRFHPVSPGYEQTVGTVNDFRRQSEGTWAGDPARAARILVDIVGRPEPPLRLLLGAQAVEIAAKASAERASEADRWAEVSRSADFPA